MTTYVCTKCDWKGPTPTPWMPIGTTVVCPECGSLVENIDLDERIAIRVIDGGQDEEEAREKAMAELEIWFEELAT